MQLDKLIIKGARENNLKNISLELPRNKLIVMTGLSGSGKTTLAFDTIYAEGQRRYVESLSAYARQFLGGLEKPDVDSIEGLSPAIAIDQKSTSHNPRSTVGTVTEIYDYLRLLFARIGVPYCPTHHIPIEAQSVRQMVDRLYEQPIGTKIQILSPIAYEKKGTYRDTFEKLAKSGFVRVRVDGEMMLIDDVPELEKNKKHTIDIVIDRIVLDNDSRTRLSDSLEIALKWSDGLAIAITGSDETIFSARLSCPICGFNVPKLEPRLFSFNAPMGACETCKGLGIKQEVRTELLVPNKNLSLNQGALAYRSMAGSDNIEWQDITELCRAYKIDMDLPFGQLSEYEQGIIFNGSDRPLTYKIGTRSGNQITRNGFVEGVKKRIERLYLETSSEGARAWYATFMGDVECDVCQGRRLNERALAVKVGSKSIHEVTELSISDSVTFFNTLSLSNQQREIAKLILKEIEERLGFLNNVGLDYLTLSRSAGTLSGGESQRIRLATQIGSHLTGVLYVLDEPSIGLHQRDNARLIQTLHSMRDLGNTLIVVEHDEDTMRAADWLVDIGPGSGEHGGQVIVSGTPEDVMACPESITGQYLTGKQFIAVPKQRRKGNGLSIEIKGATANNLKNIDVKIPLGCFVAVTGVSGSGKSTLINDILGNSLRSDLSTTRIVPGAHRAILGRENIDKLIDVTQDPIGRTPRSNPATYTGVFDDIRTLFASTKEAKARGYEKGRFSFNVRGGRCERCQGDGMIRVPMHFLPDVFVPCEECGGKRYNEETLKVLYKDKNIAEVLDMTIENGYLFFENIPGIARKLKTLVDVGLGYIRLGQSATTFSGGEAQRVKLAYELQRRSTGQTLYIFDEPTTGLHSHDVKRLLEVMNRIVENGDSIVVIEHNLDVIKVADHIIDLGPEGGFRGGQVIATGTPEQIITVEQSYTGKFLRHVLLPSRTE